MKFHLSEKEADEYMKKYWGIERNLKARGGSSELPLDYFGRDSHIWRMTGILVAYF